MCSISQNRTISKVTLTHHRMMRVSWVSSWCPACALLWVLPSQSSCLSPSGHGRGKAELAERLLLVLQFRGHPWSSHCPAPASPRGVFASCGLHHLALVPSPRSPVHIGHGRGGVFIAPVLCQTERGLSTSISLQKYFSIVGVQWGDFP